MKKNLLTVCGIFSLVWASIAQITVTDATLPQVGDTFQIAVDNMPEGIEITPPGVDQHWDFSGLAAPFSQEIIYRPASEGSVADQVPTANLYTEIAGTESYYRVTDNTVELVAVQGPDPVGFDFVTLIRFTPAILQKEVPMTFPQQNSTAASVLLTFSPDDLPPELLDQLPFPVLPDSIRLNIVTERTDFVDAYGTITIPDGTYEVLREKRTEDRETLVEVLLPIVGWVDVTETIIANTPFEGLGQQTIVTYHFFSNDEKVTIAEAQMDENEENVVSVTYKSDEVINNVSSRPTVSPNVYAYPNPAITDVRFEFTNLKAGRYKLKIFNILGVAVWQQDYYINGNLIEKVNFSDLRKGTYLYSLIDDTGKTVTTKRLMIVRP